MSLKLVLKNASFWLIREKAPSMTLEESMQILKFVCICIAALQFHVIFCNVSGNHFIVNFISMYLWTQKFHFFVVQKFNSA